MNNQPLHVADIQGNTEFDYTKWTDSERDVPQYGDPMGMAWQRQLDPKPAGLPAGILPTIPAPPPVAVPKLAAPAFDYAKLFGGTLEGIAKFSMNGLGNWLGGLALLGSFIGPLSILATLGTLLCMTGLMGKLDAVAKLRSPKEKAAGTWIYYSIAQEGSAPFIKYLKGNGIKLDNVHTVEDRCLFGVAAYHTGVFERAARQYDMDYKKL